jgi:hypothetical protein
VNISEPGRTAALIVDLRSIELKRCHRANIFA